MTGKPVDLPVSPSLLGVLVFVLLLVAFNFIFGPYFPLPGFRMGHDFSLGLTTMLDGYIWYRSNGLAIPWFTPAFCAGQPFYADPQSGYYSVLQGLAFFVNPVTASYLTMLVMAGLAYWGGYSLMRLVFQAGTAVAVLAGGLFMLNGFLPYRMIIGHLGYHGFALLPWVALLLLMPVRHRADALMAAAMAGLLMTYWIHGGLGTLILPAGFGVLTVALLWGLRNGAMVSFLARSLLAIVVALAISASKLIAATSFMKGFLRDFYPLPGVHSIWDAIVMVLSSLFLSSEQTYSIMNNRFENAMWTHLPHEWAFGFTPAVAVLIASLLVILILRGKLSWPVRSRTWVLTSLLATCLLWPVAFSTYEPSWNAFLKTMPILGSSSTPIRWMVLYIPFVAVGTALLLHLVSRSERQSWLVTLVTLAGMVTLTAMEPRKFYLSQDYDVKPVLLADALIREGSLKPKINALGVDAMLRVEAYEKPLTLNDTFIVGVSQVFCYNPIFGYRLEKFSSAGLVSGDVFQSPDGRHLNMKNPACYVFPEENACRPGDRFRINQLDQARSFVNYHAYDFNLSNRQLVANTISRWSLWLFGLIVLTWGGWKVWLCRFSRNTALQKGSGEGS